MPSAESTSLSAGWRLANAGEDLFPGLLVIDDDQLTIQYVKEALDDRPVSVFGAADVEEGIACARRLRPRLVLLDLHLPGGSGLDAMTAIQEVDPEIQVFIMTADYSTASAVRAIQAGAGDYLNKPLSLHDLYEKIDRWLSEEREKCESARLEAQLLGKSNFEGIIGRSPAMLEVFSKIKRIAPHFSTALVTGETGTGKELAARALHSWSKRTGPLIVCNCAAIVETLFESELFGHTKGSFTGAVDNRSGLVECAQGGTLFLDEIGETPMAVQAKLLRLLQTREVRKVGGSSARNIDVRIIAATNRDLRRMVAEGTFREDLFYRLSTVHFKLPRLKDRQEDLPLLIQHFLNVFSAHCGKPQLTLTRRARTLLNRHSWPGNIRELENAMSYACMLAENGLVDAGDFPEYMLAAESLEGDSAIKTIAQMQYEHAVHVLKECSGNRARAAEVLGIGRATLYRLLGRESNGDPS